MLDKLMIFSVKRIALLGFLACLGLVACKEQVYQTIEELDTENIQNYIRENNLQVEPLGNSGMFYQILEEGTGSTLSYSGKYPLVYTVRSLDGVYNLTDTFALTNRYFDFLGYFRGASPQGSDIASIPSYQNELEKDEGLKMAINRMLGKTNGKIRVLIPSRLMNYGRNGDSDLGIPSNASMDIVVQVLDSAAVPAYEDLSIRNRLETLGLTDYEKTESGIYYHISELGDGDTLTVDSTITCSYAGTLLNGTSFGSADSATFLINGNIQAWREIIPKIRKGGSVRFFAPSAMTYGLAGSSPIPPFSPLDFQVTVRKED